MARKAGVGAIARRQLWQSLRPRLQAPEHPYDISHSDEVYTGY